MSRRGFGCAGGVIDGRVAWLATVLFRLVSFWCGLPLRLTRTKTLNLDVPASVIVSDQPKVIDCGAHYIVETSSGALKIGEARKATCCSSTISRSQSIGLAMC